MSTEFVMDLTNYKDRFGTNVPKGRYRVVVDDAEMDTSKNGNKMINMWYRILDGDHADKTIIDRLMPEGKAQFRLVSFMQAIGLRTPKKRLQLKLSQFIGQVLEIDVEDGAPYNGRVKTEVRGYLPAASKSTGGAAGSDADDLDEYAGEEEDEEVYEDTEDEEIPGDYDTDSDDDGDDDADDEEAVEEAATEDEAEEESEPEEEPEPAPVKRTKPAAKKAPAKRKPAPEPEEDEDDQLDIDDIDLG